MAAHTVNELSPTRRQALRAAAQWYARLCAEEAGQADEHALDRWLASDPLNQWAWDRVDRLQKQFGHLPGSLALDTLDRAQQHLNVNRRHVLKGLVSLAGAGTLGLTAYRYAPARHWLADHHTATGEIKRLTLADGSTLILNTASAVDIRFGENRRLVLLREGEIMVSTVKDTAPIPRPFFVQTPQGRVRALGTRFSVRALPAETQVAVYEHRVEVIAQNGSQRICPSGKQLIFTADAVTAPAELAATTDAWTRQMLVVEAMRLDDFIAELGRYRSGVLRCDPAVAHHRISGAFRVDDTDQALRALAKSFPVMVNQRTRYWVTVAAR